MKFCKWYIFPYANWIWSISEQISVFGRNKGKYRPGNTPYLEIFDTENHMKFEIRICDDAVLEIYLDHKFQWPQEGFNFESLAREVVNWWPSGLGNYFACKRFTVQTFLWSLEFEIQINLEHDTIAFLKLARSWSISTK